MQTDNKRENCTVVIGSLTQAMRAKQVLARAAILSYVEKVDTAQVRRGCAYALRYPCQLENDVRTALQNGGVRPKAKWGKER